MARVRLGLAFYYSKILSYLLLIALGLMGPFFGGLLVASAGQMGMVILYATVAGLLMFAALSPFAGMLAAILCLWGMPRMRGRGLAAVSLLLDLLACGLMATGIIWMTERIAERSLVLPLTTIAVLLLGMLASVAAWVSFLLFLRRLTILLEGENAVAVDEPFVLIVLGLCLLLAPVAIVGLTALIARSENYRIAAPLVFYIASLALLVGYVKLLVKNLNLLAHVRQAIQDRLPK